MILSWFLVVHFLKCSDHLQENCLFSMSKQKLFAKPLGPNVPEIHVFEYV